MKPELTDKSRLHNQPVLGVPHPCLGDSNFREPPHLLSIYLDSGDKNSGSHLPRPCIKFTMNHHTCNV